MGNDEILPINVFKHSFGPILELLNESELKYQMRQKRSGSVTMCSEVIEVIINSAPACGAIAAIIIAFIKVKNSREVTIQTKDDRVIHAKGLNSEQLKMVINEASSITAIDTGKE